MERCRLDGSGEVVPITDVTAIINEADYRDSARLLTVLQSHRTVKAGRCYRVEGTWERIDDLSVQLSAAFQPEAPGSRQQSEEPPSPLTSVSVSASVMRYIQQKCPDELRRIAGSRFFMELQPEVRPEAGEDGRTLLLTFRPRNPTEPRHRAAFVRQRFVTFYQKTASNLAVTDVPLSSSHKQDLQRRFPQLLFESSAGRPQVAVTGTFPHVALARECLLQKPLRGPDRTTSSTSAADRREGAEEPCPICLESVDPTRRTTLECKHSFCTECLGRAFLQKPVCPTCGRVYGVLRGTQPEGGRMEVSRTHSSLPGYEQYGTIVIRYSIPSGIQQEEHPSPGEPYSGASRRAFLPDCPEGRRVLRLLRKAFDQRLVFTVGQSTSTSRKNTVTWNDVHHKTSVHGGPTHYGYPDPDYLRRVEEELAAKGIR